MPGANSIIAANHVYSVAKPDGLTIGTFNRNLPIAQPTRVEGVKFDLTQYAWIGSAASEPTVLAIRSDLPLSTDHNPLVRSQHLGNPGRREGGGCKAERGLTPERTGAVREDASPKRQRSKRPLSTDQGRIGAS